MTLHSNYRPEIGEPRNIRPVLVSDWGEHGFLLSIDAEDGTPLANLRITHEDATALARKIMAAQVIRRVEGEL